MNFTKQEIENYCINKSTTHSELADSLEKYTRDNVPLSQMLIGKLEGSFLAFLIKSIDAKRILEIGTFTGYSALVMAECKDDVHVTTLDVNKKTTAFARKYWDQSPAKDRITGVNGQAVNIMQELRGPFDLIFIDADKRNYLNYLRRGLELLSENGIVVIDNCLWSGNVLQNHTGQSNTKGIQSVNDYVASRDDLHATMLPVRDGMYLIRKNSK